jgi:hypothetical protein
VQVDENIRSKTVLDEVFSSDDSTYISITSHSGEIASILQGMGRFLLSPWLYADGLQYSATSPSDLVRGK